MAEWHGVSFWLYPRLSPAVDLEAASDAAGSIGFGAYFKGFRFAGPWAVSQQQQSIAYKELFPVVVAARVWGPQWSKKHVLSRSDNDAVVHMLNWRTSNIPSLRQLLRSLLLSTARCSVSFSAEHIPDVHNQIADALSRICWQEFRRLAPADSSPAPVGIDHLSLEQRCHAFLVHGLAPSSRKTAQRKFFNLSLLFFIFLGPASSLWVALSD